MGHGYYQVTLSGAVEGKAEWPKKLKPVAWHSDAEMVRMKLGLYHSKDNVADGEVEYKNISIEGPAGIIRTSTLGVKNSGAPEGAMYLGCFKDDKKNRVLSVKTKSDDMTLEVRAGNLEINSGACRSSWVRTLAPSSLTLRGTLSHALPLVVCLNQRDKLIVAIL